MENQSIENQSVKSIIIRLENFQQAIRSIDQSSSNLEIRRAITRESVWVRRKVMENGCLKLYTFSPPSDTGGLVMRDTDVFNYIFDPPNGLAVIPKICDMIDLTIAHILDPAPLTTNNIPESDSVLSAREIKVNYAFVAMAIDNANNDLVDTLDAVKEACKRCGIFAERIDEDQSNERITDRILASIDAAEHIIADLTLERPNVFYEAGYALGKGKIPIYIAKAGTKLHFDLKDYPIIFFLNYKQLKDELEGRLRALATKQSNNINR